MNFLRNLFGDDDPNEPRKLSRQALTSGRLSLDPIASLEHGALTFPHVSFSPDHQYLTTTSGATTSVWKTQNGKLARSFSWGKGRFGYDSEHIVLTEKGGLVGIGNIHTGKILLEVEEDVEQSDNDLQSKSISADPYFSQDHYQLIIHWSPSTMTERERAFVTPGLSYLQIRDGNSGDILHQFDNLVRKQAGTEAFYLSNDNRLLALIYDKAESIPIVDTATGEVLVELPVNPAGLLLRHHKKLTFSGDNRYVGFQRSSHYHVHRVETGEEVSASDERASDKSKLFAFSTADSIYIYDSEASPAKVVDAISGDTVAQLTNFPKSKKTKVAISPNGQYIASTDQQKLLVHDIQTGDHVSYQNPIFKENDLEFSPNSEYLIVHPLLTSTKGFLLYVASNK